MWVSADALGGINCVGAGCYKLRKPSQSDPVNQTEFPSWSTRALPSCNRKSGKRVPSASASECPISVGNLLAISGIALRFCFRTARDQFCHFCERNGTVTEARLVVQPPRQPPRQPTPSFPILSPWPLRIRCWPGGCLRSGSGAPDAMAGCTVAMAVDCEWALAKDAHAL